MNEYMGRLSIGFITKAGNIWDNWLIVGEAIILLTSLTLIADHELNIKVIDKHVKNVWFVQLKK